MFWPFKLVMAMKPILSIHVVVMRNLTFHLAKGLKLETPVLFNGEINIMFLVVIRRDDKCQL